MRRLADELGIQAPSLYKHFPDKDSITTAIYVDYLEGQAEALEAALAAPADDHALVRVSEAYRSYARRNEALYRFVHLLPYPRTDAADILRRLRIAWLKAAGDSDLAICAYAFTRGMVDMEIHSLYPVSASPESVYQIGLEALVQRAARQR